MRLAALVIALAAIVVVALVAYHFGVTNASGDTVTRVIPMRGRMAGFGGGWGFERPWWHHGIGGFDYGHNRPGLYGNMNGRMRANRQKATGNRQWATGKRGIGYDHFSAVLLFSVAGCLFPVARCLAPAGREDANIVLLDHAPYAARKAQLAATVIEVRHLRPSEGPAQSGRSDDETPSLR